MELVLRHNIFTFHDSYWKQEVGAAMGSKPVPHYADTFMARTVDPEITNLAHKFDTNEQKVMQLLKKFLDDYFSIFNGSTKNLHLLWDEMNKISPSIKLTMNHTSILGENIEDKCDCKEAYEIPFLDTLCSIKNGRIETDLYRKETDRNQYILPSSCHPKQTTKAIPYSLALRNVRICSEPKQRHKRQNELQTFLLNRGYQEKMALTELALVRACCTCNTSKGWNEG